MKRSKIHVLFKMLPNQTFVWQNKNAIFKVDKFRVIKREDLVKQSILHRLSFCLKIFSGNTEEFPRNIYERDLYILCEPEAVIGNLFPLVFECINSSCRKMHDYKSVENLRIENPNCRCTLCDSKLQQLRYIATHSCGNVEQLYVPKCNKHEKQHIVLERGQAQKFQNFKWVCKKCNKIIQKGLYQICFPCKSIGKKDYKMVIQVQSGWSTYIPKSFNMIYLKDKDYLKIFDSDSYAEIVIGAYLNDFDHPNVTIEDFYNGKLNTEPGMDNLIEKINATSSLQKKQKLIDSYNLLNDENLTLDTLPKISTKEIRNQIKDELLDIEVDRKKNIASSLYYYIKPMEKRSADSKNLRFTYISDLIEIAEQRFPQKIPVYKTYSEYLTKNHLGNFYVIEGFPILICVYGYTRLQSSGNNVTLKAFPMIENKIPLYVNLKTTEGIYIELDKRKVLNWLFKNGIFSDDPKNLSDKEIKLIFLKRLIPFREFGKNINDEFTKYTFSLLHTISHIFLKEIGILSGFESTSLSEYIIPEVLTTVIFANTIESYNMGGMMTLFEQSFINLLKKSRLGYKTCLYDPVCSSHESSCHACIQLSEISCCWMNNFLGRRYLFGGLDPENNREVYGYWE